MPFGCVFSRVSPKSGLVNRAAKLSVLLIASALPIATAFAQDLPDVAQGLQPYIAYHGGQLDKVSTANGGLSVSIPLVSYPQKGSLALSYSVIFNSFGFEDIAICDASVNPTEPISTIPLKSGCTNTIALIPTGVTGDYPQSPRIVADQQLSAAGVMAYDHTQDVPPLFDGRFYVIGADSSQHPLAPTDTGFRSVDDAGYLFASAQPPSSANLSFGSPVDTYPGDTRFALGTASGTITDSHGVTYSSGVMQDPDLNRITLNTTLGGMYAGLPATDSVGRNIPAPAPAGTGACPLIQAAQFQPVTSALQWTVPGEGPNGLVSYLFCYVNVNIYTHFIIGSSSASSQLSTTVSMLQSIVLPNGTYWGFIYDSNNPNTVPTPNSNATSNSLGELTTLIYPTGGTVSYTYQTYKGFCNSARANGLNSSGAAILAYPAAINTRTMTDSQGNILGTWTYSLPTGGQPGSILSPGNNLTVTKFTRDTTGSGCQLLDAGSTTYSGSSTFGPLLSDTSKSYAFTFMESRPYASAPRESLTVMTLPDGKTSSVQKAYATGINFYPLVCNNSMSSCAHGAGLPMSIGGPVSVTYTGYDGSVLRQESTSYQWQVNPSYLAANMLDIPSNTSITNDSSTTPAAQITYAYDEGSYSPGGTLGHNTSTTQVQNTMDVSPTIHTGWNSSGMKIYTINPDANAGVTGHLNPGTGHTTDYQYNSCAGSALTDSYNALGQHLSARYDCNTGLLVSLTDANTNTTTVNYDAMQRIQTVTYPPVPAGTPTTTFTYLDAQNTVTKTVLASPNPTQSTQVVFDSFGREVHRYITASPSRDEVDTSYDADGRVQSVTNPYRSGNPVYATTYTYDALNRKTLVQEPDGNVLQTCYDDLASTGQSNCSPNASSLSSESWTDTTDESGNHWQHVSDALGRLVAVVEPGLYATNYTYDALGNLTAVSQLGNGTTDTPRTRSFTYNSLSRLLTSTNPETGQICYGQWSGGAVGAGTCQGGYDPNGNLLYKTDARGLTLAYTYDALNRLTFRTASDGSPIAAFGYDGNNEYGTPLSNFGITSNNAIGRMSLQSNQVNAAAAYSYDPMGRLVLQNTVTPYIPSWGTLTSAQYDLAGNMTSLTYPDGQAISQTFDAAGRLSSVNNAAVNASYSYLNVNSYDAAGHVTSYTDGSGTTMTEAFNNRQQPISLSYTSAITPTPPLWSKSLQWTPNGNLSTAVDNVLGMTRQFTYDSLNRLMSAQDYTGTGASLLPNPNGLSQSFSYDSFGNIQQTGNSFQFSPTYLANNRMFGYAYDASGNLLGDNLTLSMTYDANERIATLNSTQYTYLPTGERVSKSVPRADTIYFGGRSIARYFNAGISGRKWTDLIYGPNGLLAELTVRSTLVPEYRMLDHLGTEIGSIDSYMNVHINDYAPFGQAISSGDTDPYKFTGKERDTESGLDYFGARYYSSSMGRFSSPDFQDDDTDPEPVPWADYKNPQSLNLYSYVYNSPVSHSDSDGHDVNVCSNDSNGNQKCSLISNAQYQAGQQANNGGLNVPSLTSVGAQGTANITDSSGNTVGTATYVPNSGVDFYSNQGAYAQLSGAANVVNKVGGAEMAVISIAMPELLADTAIEAGISGGAKLGEAAANRINHVFQAKHKLDALVAQFGGKQGAYEAIAQATQRAVAGTAGPFQTTVQVGSETVVVRGAVVDGIVKIATAFKP